MLEVINLTKVYKTKGGADVRALDGVSLRFPETGMVFLLGRSGSGKSTLLNVCGGLDSPTDGEIIVKGKSSQDFTQSDFDSYRNTFVGFIFQEYNILDEFTVEDNIALALELQGKPKDKKAVAGLLEQVELQGFAKRKPNTLSGGQKQRIAIARALVKSPEIIMADEPTGALDSATGKQVFDTLKKLSEKKLVIVVSHDRDFAEQYGDRIIELKDGKVISDITKTQEKSVSLGVNLTAVGSDTLYIKKGATLDAQDFENLKNFLSRAESDIVIAKNEKDVKNFKQTARITDDGAKEVFKKTDENKLPKKSYTPEESKFIRSRLPARHALKIGASGLKSKPLRLIFTILLSTISFVMFGLLSTMMTYNKEQTLKKSLTNSSYSELCLRKKYDYVKNFYYDNQLSHSYRHSDYTDFTEAEAEELIKKFGSDSFAAFSLANGILNINHSNSEFYSTELQFVAYLPQSNTFRNKIRGSYPKEGKKEICISSFLAESLIKSGLYDPETENPYRLASADDVIGKKIRLQNDTYTVSGIFDVKANPLYEKLKTDTSDYQLCEDWQNELSSGLYQVVFVDRETESTLNKKAYDFREIFSDSPKPVNISFRDYTASCSYALYDEQNPPPAVFFREGKTSLAENEAVLSAESLSRFLDEATSDILSALEQEAELRYSNECVPLWNEYYDLEDKINRAQTEGDWDSVSELTEQSDRAKKDGMLQRTRCLQKRLSEQL